MDHCRCPEVGGPVVGSRQPSASPGRQHLPNLDEQALGPNRMLTINKLANIELSEPLSQIVCDEIVVLARWRLSARVVRRRLGRLGGARAVTAGAVRREMGRVPNVSRREDIHEGLQAVHCREVRGSGSAVSLLSVLSVDLDAWVYSRRYTSEKEYRAVAHLQS